MTNEDRFERYELLLNLLIHGFDSESERAMIGFLKTKYPSGSCGDGAFDRKERRRQEDNIDACINFVKYGKFLDG